MKYIAVVCVVVFALLGVAFGLKNPVCGEPVQDEGEDVPHCLALMPSYQYHADANYCELFTYGGCGGSDNKFESLEECEAMCKE